MATALAMAPEAERAEIKRQQSILKQDLAAAKAEAAIEGKGRASKAEDANLAEAEHQTLRGRVRELLDQIHTNSDSSASSLPLPPSPSISLHLPPSPSVSDSSASSLEVLINLIASPGLSYALIASLIRCVLPRSAHQLC